MSQKPSLCLEAAPLTTLEEMAVQKTCDVAIIVGAAFAGLEVWKNGKQHLEGTTVLYE